MERGHHVHAVLFVPGLRALAHIHARASLPDLRLTAAPDDLQHLRLAAAAGPTAPGGTWSTSIVVKSLPEALGAGESHTFARRQLPLKARAAAQPNPSLPSFAPRESNADPHTTHFGPTLLSTPWETPSRRTTNDDEGRLHRLRTC